MVGAVGSGTNYFHGPQTFGASYRITRENYRQVLGANADVQLNPQQMKDLFEKGYLDVQRSFTQQESNEGMFTIAAKALSCVIGPSRSIGAMSIDPKFLEMIKDPSAEVGFGYTRVKQETLRSLPYPSTPPAPPPEPKPPATLPAPVTAVDYDWRKRKVESARPVELGTTPAAPQDIRIRGYYNHDTGVERKSNQISTVNNLSTRIRGDARLASAIGLRVSASSNVLGGQAYNNSLTSTRLHRFNREIPRSGTSDNAHRIHLANQFGVMVTGTAGNHRVQSASQVQPGQDGYPNTQDTEQPFQPAADPEPRFLKAAQQLFETNLPGGGRILQTNTDLVTGPEGKREISAGARQALQGVLNSDPAYASLSDQQKEAELMKLAEYAQSYVDFRGYEVDMNVTVTAQNVGQLKDWLATTPLPTENTPDRQLYDRVQAEVAFFESSSGTGKIAALGANLDQNIAELKLDRVLDAGSIQAFKAQAERLASEPLVAATPDLKAKLDTFNQLIQAAEQRAATPEPSGSLAGSDAQAMAAHIEQNFDTLGKQIATANGQPVMHPETYQSFKGAIENDMREYLIHSGALPPDMKLTTSAGEKTVSELRDMASNPAQIETYNQLMGKGTGGTPLDLSSLLTTAKANGSAPPEVKAKVESLGQKYTELLGPDGRATQAVKEYTRVEALETIRAEDNPAPATNGTARTAAVPTDGAARTGAAPPDKPMDLYLRQLPASLGALDQHIASLSAHGPVTPAQKTAVQQSIAENKQNLLQVLQGAQVPSPGNGPLSIDNMFNLQAADLEKAVPPLQPAQMTRLAEALDVLKNTEASLNTLQDGQQLTEVRQTMGSIRHKIDSFEARVVGRAVVGEMQQLATDKPEQFKAVFRQAFDLTSEQQEGVLNRILSAAQEGKMPVPPMIGFLEPAQLGGNNAAYLPAVKNPAGENEAAIMLSRDLLNDPAALRKAFMEEMFHHLEVASGLPDSRQDEGAAALSGMEALMAGADRAGIEQAVEAGRAARSGAETGTVTINGQAYPAEFQAPTPAPAPASGPALPGPDYSATGLNIPVINPHEQRPMQEVSETTNPWGETRITQDSSGGTASLRESEPDFWDKAGNLGSQVGMGLLKLCESGALQQIIEGYARTLESVWKPFYANATRFSSGAHHTLAEKTVQSGFDVGRPADYEAGRVNLVNSHLRDQATQRQGTPQGTAFVAEGRTRRPPPVRPSLPVTPGTEVAATRRQDGR
jgi:hypothetical protein